MTANDHWTAQVVFIVEADPDALDPYIDGATTGYYNTEDHALRLTTRLDATTYPEAIAEATTWVAALPAQQLVTAAGGHGPIRVTVEADESRNVRWMAGAAEAAQMLGISPSRIRDLEKRDPAFPTPVAELAGGKVFPADEVQTYRHTRVPGKPGRPPATGTSR